MRRGLASQKHGRDFEYGFESRAMPTCSRAPMLLIRKSNHCRGTACNNQWIGDAGERRSVVEDSSQMEKRCQSEKTVNVITCSRSFRSPCDPETHAASDMGLATVRHSVSKLVA
jgi:hypothetical protein